jgi:sRNA-binding carbon storage regulator CsrA
LEDGNVLIVGREIGQSVIIGDVVKVTVLQMGSKLQLAIDAPKQILVTQVKQNGSNRDKLKKGARIIGATTLIGDFIKVTVLETESGLLRFAIDAPKEISIFREELYKCK